MMISFNFNIPRYFIAYYLGEAELGIFTAVSYIVHAGSLVMVALGQAVSPRLAKYFHIGS